MSTRSFIAIENGDKINYIYCHFDGYPSGVGWYLMNYYNTREKAEALIALGDLSYVDKYIEPNSNEEHTYDNPQQDITVAYHRDRGEKYNLRACQNKKALHIAAKGSCAEYCYLFNNEKWYYIDSTKEPSDKTEWLELSADICGKDPCSE